MASESVPLSWEELVARVERQFGVESVSEEALLFLIGLEELGFYPEGEDKAVKLELIRLGGAVLLERAEFLRRTGTDKDGWPLFERVRPLPAWTPAQQRQFLRNQIVAYFARMGTNK